MILQINIADADIVDRCESCHIGIREPLKSLTRQRHGREEARRVAEAFVSHPDPELLRLHDPEKFGCSPCHGGNGSATTAWRKRTAIMSTGCGPSIPRRMSQAGCQQCHATDMVVDQRRC